MDEKKTYRGGDVEKITLALCLSSAITGTLWASVGGGLAAFSGMFVAAFFGRTVSCRGGCTLTDICIKAVAVSVAAAVASVGGAYMGLDTIAQGILIPSAAGASLALYGDVLGDGEIQRGLRGGGYFLLMAVSGAVREVFGRGSIFGYELDIMDGGAVGVLDSPAGGMLVCGMVAALFRFILKRGRCVTDDEI